MDQPTETPINPAGNLLAIALELRDALREVNRGLNDEGRFDREAQLSDTLFRGLLVLHQSLLVSKAEVGELVHVRETLLSMRAEDYEFQKDVGEDTMACIERLDPLINRFFFDR